MSKNCCDHIKNLWEIKFVDKYKYMKNNFGGNTLLILSFVYWAQGFRSLGRLATILYYKEHFHISPALAQLLTTLTLVGWVLKPFYGFITDNYPIYGYNRKPYLLILGALGLVSILSISFYDNVYLVMISLTLSEFSQAFSDVCADAIMVEKSRNDEFGSSALQSFSWFVLACGGIFGSVLGGELLYYLNPKTIIILTSISPLFLLISACGFKETPSQEVNTINNLNLLFESVKNPEISRIILFIVIIVGVTPSFSDTMVYYYIDVLDISKIFISSLKVFVYVSLLIGSWIYHNCFKKISFRTIFFVGQVFLTMTCFSDLVLIFGLYKTLGLPAWIFVGFGSVFTEFITFTFIQIPTMIIAAKVCPVGIEGTFFSLLSSIAGFSVFISSLTGSIFTNVLDVGINYYDNVWKLPITQIAFSIIPLCFIWIMPSNTQLKEKEPLLNKEEKDNNN